MHSPRFRRRPGWLIPALLLIGSGGCGLTDYEARLEVQEKQLRYMEEENKNLSDRPVGLSDRMTEDGRVNYKQFYLRLPLGLSPSVDERPEGKFDVYLPNKKESGFHKVLLTVDNDEDVEKFKNDAVKAILKAPVNSTTKSIPRLSDKPLVFDLYQKDSVQLYIPRDSYYRVAIAFFPSGYGSQALVDERIKFCLASFADGKKAETKRRASRPTPVKKEAGDKAGTKKGPKGP